MPLFDEKEQKEMKKSEIREDIAAVDEAILKIQKSLDASEALAASVAARPSVITGAVKAKLIVSAILSLSDSFP